MTIGTPIIGTPGTATGTPAPVETYRHLRDGVFIPGATSLDYTSVAADEGTEHILEGTMTNPSGTDVEWSTAKIIGPILPSFGISFKTPGLNPPQVNIDDSTITVAGSKYMLQANDVFVLQRSTNSNFANATVWSKTINSAEATARAFTTPTGGAWPAGVQLYARMMIFRGGTMIARSNSLSTIF